MSKRGSNAAVNMRSQVKPSHKVLMTKVLASGLYSDLTIVCGDRRFPVHKVIVCERSELVRAAMARPFREAAENEIRLDQFEPEAVHGALYYVYTLCYPTVLKTTMDGALKAKPEITPEYWTQVGKLYWTYDLELYKVADYLGLGALAKLAYGELNGLWADPSTDLFLSRTSGYAILVRQLYHEPAAEKMEKGYDDAEIYVELLKDIRKLLLTSTSSLVAKNIKNENLDRLTAEIPKFKQDVFFTLAEPEERTAIALELKKSPPAGRPSSLAD